MFALRACRSSLLATRRPLGLSRRAIVTEATPSSVEGFLEDLIPETHSEPPKAGPSGYPPPSLENPFKKRDISTYLKAPPRYRLHCKSTRNNTITTLTQPDGKTVCWFSGGSCGFKKVNRSSYEAGYQCAVRMFKKIEELKKNEIIELDLFFKGFGQGRDALHRALMTSEGEQVRPLVNTITDRTPIKIGGTRAKKMRRL